MAKQITLSTGDTGVIFEIQLVDNNNAPLDLNSVTITGTIKQDTVANVLEQSQINIVDLLNGIVDITLGSEDTATEGLHEIYITLTSQNFNITTINAVNYYVIEKNGGV